MIKIGIYGYECTKEVSFSGYKILPKYTQHSEVKKFASDPLRYHLTAILEIDKNDNSNELIFLLEAVLSFIEHRDVTIQNKLHPQEDLNNLSDDYPLFIDAHKRHNGGGAKIISDTFSCESRKKFITLAMAKLTDNSTVEAEAFRKAFFKTIEVFRSRELFIDISFYLRFSALESLARAVFNDYSNHCAPAITKLLTRYNLDIKQENLKEPHKSVMTYVCLRNALFHNGLLEVCVTRDGNSFLYKQSEFSSTLAQLIPLVMIKYIGFDDGYINWNSWLDRQAFSRPSSC
nr:hypothetical protein [uncultured Tolumonas sp.]